MEDDLRDRLLRYVKNKFYSYPNIAALADDIVNEAYVSLLSSKSYRADKENFGYLSVTCIRIAYKFFMSDTPSHESLSEPDGVSSRLISEDDFVDELVRDIDMKTVLDSFAVLRDVERIVITEHYYNDFSFTEIADNHGIKLNTVLSHHRRALQKLRPVLTRLMDFTEDDGYYERRIHDGGSLTKYF